MYKGRSTDAVILTDKGPLRGSAFQHATLLRRRSPLGAQGDRVICLRTERNPSAATI